MSAEHCAEYRALLEQADDCDQQRARLADDTPTHERGRRLLAETAAAARSAAEVFTVDPTLHDEPFGTGRLRAVDLLCELGRQVPNMVRWALSDRRLAHQPAEERWAEAEALATRAGEIAQHVLATVPRTDHATVEGSQAISLERLATRHNDLAEAADTIRAALAPAARLPHPTGQVSKLEGLAGALDRFAAELAQVHEKARAQIELPHSRRVDDDDR
jgi:hypothetical protein